MLSCRMKIAACAGLVAATFLFSSIAIPMKSLGETASGQIAFVREGARHGIYTIDPSTAIVTRLTNGEDYRPRWSPDGTRIVFQRFFSGPEWLQSDLFLMNADGTDQVRLTHNRFADTVPAWSPDGTTIAFASGPHRNVDIYLMAS